MTNFLYSLKTLPLVPLARADVLRRAGTGITQMPPGSTRRQHLGMQ